ncbi:hypoxanthine-guanine phosphoribosyltransferase [Methylococcus sp. EFPC2]|uniref:hypoxanthine-guanine phosphoribosyltransferase n=1 Tax=Methylococcus sp. EFPC2 TaxID=2812648 RepID=UPI001F08345B|nr:hypoxanthine-guanine phosphoribosyltransferase [Methylococcus sp. EFPC2]
MNLIAEVRRVEAEAELIYGEAEVEAAISRTATEISEQLADQNPLVLAVLNGGIIFAGKLLPRLNFPLQLDAVNASRYRGETQGSHIQWLLKPSHPLKDRAVLLVDDVLDEGVTLAELIAYCHEEGAASVHVAVLIDKQIGRERPCEADFVGLKAPNRYLFGYGMDYKNYLRNAPGIYACKHL